MDLGNAGKLRDWLYVPQRCRVPFPSNVIAQVSCFWLYLLILRAEGNGGMAASFPHPFKHSTTPHKEARLVPSTSMFLWEVSFSRYSSSSADLFLSSFLVELCSLVKISKFWISKLIKLMTFFICSRSLWIMENKKWGNRLYALCIPKEEMGSCGKVRGVTRWWLGDDRTCDLVESRKEGTRGQGQD